MSLNFDSLLEGKTLEILKKARKTQTANYAKDGKSLFENENSLLSYLVTRMPATQGVAKKVLQQLPYSISALLDLGAGTGAASWAAAEIFDDLQQIICIEQSPKAIALGKQLGANSPFAALQKATWFQQSVYDPLPKSECAIASYVINELKDPLDWIERVWNIAETVILIEPGTPKHFEQMRKIREKFKGLGANIIAPCFHGFTCPIAKGDWCHFSARIERTKWHRQMKEGSLGYEDEKFCYLIVSKRRVEQSGCRVVRRPEQHAGFVRLNVCCETGKLEERVVTRSDKERYKSVKKLEWGDVM